jgi:hypothetical protein
MTPVVVQYDRNDTHTRVCKHTSAYDTITFSLSCPSPWGRELEQGGQQLSLCKHKDAYTCDAASIGRR